MILETDLTKHIPTPDSEADDQEKAIQVIEMGLERGYWLCRAKLGKEAFLVQRFNRHKVVH
jgi:hypothetical protein